MHLAQSMFLLRIWHTSPARGWWLITRIPHLTQKCSQDRIITPQSRWEICEAPD